MAQKMTSQMNTYDSVNFTCLFVPLLLCLMYLWLGCDNTTQKLVDDMQVVATIEYLGPILLLETSITMRGYSFSFFVLHLDRAHTFRAPATLPNSKLMVVLQSKIQCHVLFHLVWQYGIEDFVKKYKYFSKAQKHDMVP